MTASQQIPPPSPDGDRRPRLPLAPGALRSWTSGAGLAFVCAASPATSAVPTGLDRAPHAAHASIAAPAPASIIDSLEPTSTRVRRLVDASGLTIQQFGHVFSVSRRSVYNWLRGEALAPENVERLHRFERILRLIGRDAPRLVRAVLLTPHPPAGQWSVAAAATGAAATGCVDVGPRRSTDRARRAPTSESDASHPIERIDHST